MGAYAYVKNKTKAVKQQKVEEQAKEAAAVNITQKGEVIGPEAEIGFLHPGAGLPGEPEDFSLRVWKPEKTGGPNEMLSPETSDPKEITKEGEAEGEEGPPPLVQSHISQENHIESTNETHIQNEVKTETQETSSSSHVIKESHVSTSKEHHSHNESVPSESKHQVLEKIPETQETEKKSIKFSESIHQEDWIEREENTLPRHNPSKEGESEL